MTMMAVKKPDGSVDYHPPGHSAVYHPDCPGLCCEAQRRGIKRLEKTRGRR